MLAIQLEKAGGDVDLQLLRQLLHGKDGRMIGGWPRAAEQALVLDPAEIMTFEQFGRQDDLRALCSCPAHEVRHRIDIRIDIVGKSSSEERRVGQRGVSTYRSRWVAVHEKKN